MVRSHRRNLWPHSIRPAGGGSRHRRSSHRTPLRSRFHILRLQQLLAMSTFPKQTLLAIATFTAILLAVHYGVSSAKGLNPSTLRPIADFPSGQSSIFPIVRVPFPPPPPALAIPNPLARGLKAAANSSLESPYLNDSNGALDHFYAALRDLHNG